MHFYVIVYNIFMDILEELNPRQIEVVKNGDGPMLVLAGAGSGKTKTLIHRIAWLIAHGVASERILAVTFTNKAAKEMRQRLAELLGKNADDRFFMPWMGTFHGICVKILRLKGESIGVAKNFVIYDEDDRRALIKKIIKDLNYDSKNIKPQSVSAAISNAKNELISAESYAEIGASSKKSPRFLCAMNRRDIKLTHLILTIYYLKRFDFCVIILKSAVFSAINLSIF